MTVINLDDDAAEIRESLNLFWKQQPQTEHNLETRKRDMDSLDRLLDWAKAQWEGEHRCGGCDNGMTCQIHDCPSNPKYSDDQFCSNCALCIDPQDENNGGPCDGCICAAEDVI